MRVRITRTPPADYDIDADSLLVGRVYDVDASLGCALILEGCADLDDVVGRRATRGSTGPELASASDRPRPIWKLPKKNKPLT
jgi:hypothetical protein